MEATNVGLVEREIFLSFALSVSDCFQYLFRSKMLSIVSYFYVCSLSKVCFQARKRKCFFLLQTKNFIVINNNKLYRIVNLMRIRF